MKLNVRFLKYQFVERIKRIRNNRFVLSIFVVIFLLIVLIPLFFILFNGNINKYQGVTQHSLQERFQGDAINCVENIKEKDSVSCRRGPVVIAATDNIARKLLMYKHTVKIQQQTIKINELNSNNSEARFFRDNWGILPDLVNWFYNNVPWGPEILTFDKIILTWANAPDWLPNYKLNGVAYGKQWGKKNSGVRIFLKSLLNGVEEETKFTNKSPLLNKLNTLKYYLFNTYTNYKMSWYVNDESSAYYYGGGVEANMHREKINKMVVSDYLFQRFKNVNTNSNLGALDVYNKAKAYEYLNAQFTNLQLTSSNENLSYRDLFVLANDIYKLSTTSSFAIKDDDHNWIFDGIDKFGNVGNEVTWFQLNNKELLEQFKKVTVFVKPNQKRKIMDLTKQELTEILKDKKMANLITSAVDFNGYSSAWIQQYLLSLIVPILWTQNIDSIKNFSLNDNYQTIITAYEQLKTKPAGMPPLIKPNGLNVENFTTEEQLKIGLLSENSPINYFNKMRSFISRDWEIMNFNNSFIEAADTSLILKDIALLNVLGANPYKMQSNQTHINSEIAIDDGTVSSLQKMLRIDEDVAMGHQSAYSELSFIWGYMNQDDNYDYLKLTDRAGRHKLIKITTQNDLDTNYNCVHNVGCRSNDKHSLLSNEFINNKEFKTNLTNSPKTLLSNIVNPQLGLKTARKLWITDYSLLADYSNAIASAGEYQVSFFNSKFKNEKPLVVGAQRKEYGEIKIDEVHILNSNGNIIPFAGWWFYTRYGNHTQLLFRIVEQSWINK